jgi:hypothetical protein
MAKLTPYLRAVAGRRLEPEITKTKSATANIAAICTDTWGCHVRPNETKRPTNHGTGWSVRRSGSRWGEIFYLKELADDCAGDKVYEFFFTAPPLHLPGPAGSPINPQAIK